MPLLEQIGTIAFKNTVTVLNYVPRFQYILRLLFGLVRAFIQIILIVSQFGFKRVFFTRVNRSKLQIPEFANNLGTHSTFTAKNGIRLHMVSKGDHNKPVILFLHGFPDCWISWKNQIPYFTQKGYRCVALSMRGYVDSTKSKEVSDFLTPKLVDDIRETILFLGVQKVILVGHDWGGIAATSFASAYPEMVKKLIVLNISIRLKWLELAWYNPKQFWHSWYVYFFQLPVLPELTAKVGDYVILEDMFEKQLANNTMCEDELNLRKYYLSQPGAMTSMINYYRALYYDLNDSIHTKTDFRIQVPSKFIFGVDDDYVMAETVDGLDKYIDDVTVVRLPGVGHFIQLEAPDEVNREILNFIH